MAISAGDVKNLREKTGAGMMDCKKALMATKGNIEAAIDFLRAKGLAKAAKKALRVAAEGQIGVQSEGNRAVIVEVNCETDFVAKGEDFKQLVKTATAMALEKNCKDTNALRELTKEAATELALKCGEKVELRRFEHLSIDGTGLIGQYNHGGKIGVVIAMETSLDVAKSSAAQELAKDIAMHVAASSPKFISSDEIDEALKKREGDIYAAQLKEQGKPEKMIAQIVQGKLRKLATEVCLLDQKFVKNPDISVGKHIQAKAKEMGTQANITRFCRLNLGEGIEKKQDDLASEVAKMTGKQ